MGVAYENGIGVIQSLVKAKEWHMKAAAQEHDKSTEWWAKMSKDEKGKKGSGNTTYYCDFKR